MRPEAAKLVFDINGGLRQEFAIDTRLRCRRFPFERL
jgi:hypothetical protein